MVQRSAPGECTRLKLLITLVTLVSLTAQAELHYLKPGKPDAAILLSPPPRPDSAEQTADLDEVRAVFRAASPADKDAARAEKKYSVFSFAEAVGPFFVATNLPKTARFFEQVQQDGKTVTDLGKNYFQRPRPYTTDPNLLSGSNVEKSFSYPSGHSTESMVLGLVLVELLPEKAEAILAHARALGWHRVQLGRHYPTDIYAGRVLAQAIVKQLKRSDLFNQEFAAVKAELAAAQTAAKN